MNYADKKRIEALRRRHDMLTSRLPGYKGDASRLRAERGAITWAIAIIEEADARGLLQDLVNGGQVADRMMEGCRE